MTDRNPRYRLGDMRPSMRFLTLASRREGIVCSHRVGPDGPIVEVILSPALGMPPGANAETAHLHREVLVEAL